jgi:hypothetical protein
VKKFSFSFLFFWKREGESVGERASGRPKPFSSTPKRKNEKIQIPKKKSREKISTLTTHPQARRFCVIFVATNNNTHTHTHTQKKRDGIVIDER